MENEYNGNGIIEPVIVTVPEQAQPYTLRGLRAKDLFLLTRVISSLGIKNVAKVFDEKVNVAAITSDEVSNEDAAREVGYGTIIEIVGIVIDNLPNCQDDLFKFLAAISDLDEKQVEELPLADFINMLTDVIKMKEFKDFFTQAERFLQ